MLQSDDQGVQHAGGGVQGVHGGVDTQLGNGARQHSGGVQVREGGGRGRIRQVIGGHVHSLFMMMESTHVVTACLRWNPRLQQIWQYADGRKRRTHLDGRNGALGGGGNALLQATQIGGKGGLVADGRGNASQQGGHLGVGLGEAEDVVDEQEHVLALNVAEVLGHGQACVRMPDLVKTRRERRENCIGLSTVLK